MGKLTEKYNELLKQNGINEEKPDMGSKPNEFMTYNRNKRKNTRLLSLYRDAFFRAGFTEDQVYEVYKDLYGEKEAKKSFNKLEETGHWDDFVTIYVQNNRPDLMGFLSEKDKESCSIGGPISKETIKKFMDEKKLSADEISRIKASQVISTDCTEPLKAGVLFEKLEEIANEQQMSFLEGRINGYQDIMERPGEWYTNPCEDVCNRLKEDAVNKIQNDPVKLQKYIRALDFASKNIQVATNDYKHEMWDRERDDAQALYVPINNKIIQETKPTYKDGKYNDMFETKKLSGSDFRSVKINRKDDFNELRNDKFHMSERTREGMKKILQKMEEMELYKHSVSANGEDGDKTYAYCKIKKSQAALIEALNEENPNPDKIIAAQETYEKDWNDIQEMFQIAKEYFSQDPTFFPGNMDSVRTDSLPIHFTQDVMTTGQINNLFLTHLALKNTNVSMDKWLENPTGALVNGFVEGSQKGSFEELSKEASSNFADSVDLLLQKGKYRKVGDNYLLSSSIIMASRSVDGPTALETDHSIRNGNIVYVDTMAETMRHVVQNETTKFSFATGRPLNEADEQMRQELFEKMVVVSDEDRNLNAMLGVPETDILGGIISPGIDLNEYVKSHQPDYDQMMKRGEHLAERVGGLNLDNLSKDDMIEFATSAYSKVLLAHPEDIELEGYQKMAEAVMNAPKELSSEASPKQKAKVNEIAERTRAFFDPAASLDAVDAAVEDAQKNVYRGSQEYDDAGAALKDVKTAYADLMYNSQDDAEMTKEKIAELRAKIDTADKAIDSYFARKTRQGLYGENKKEEPSPKTQKRINIMEKAKGNLITYLARLDEIEKKGNIEAERQAERDKIRNVQKTEAEMIEQTANQYKESFEKTDNTMEKYVSKCALAAHGVLRTLAEGKGPDLLDEAQMEVVKKGLASMMLYEIMQTQEGDKLRNQVPKNMYTYNNELKNFMSQEAFGKVMPISMTRQELKSALKDRTYIQNLQEKFNKEVEREVKRDYKAQLAKETQANVNRDVQRDRSNAIQKNPASRGRSNTVYEKNTKPEGPKTEAGHGMGGPK